MTPLDLVKCRLQVDKEKYKSLGNGFKLTVAEQGARGLFLGWAPTLIGYSMQGLCKFGFYEFFKNIYPEIEGHDNTDDYAPLTRLMQWAALEADSDANMAARPSAPHRSEALTLKFLGVLHVHFPHLDPARLAGEQSQIAAGINKIAFQQKHQYGELRRAKEDKAAKSVGDMYGPLFPRVLNMTRRRNEADLVPACPVHKDMVKVGASSHLAVAQAAISALLHERGDEFPDTTLTPGMFQAFMSYMWHARQDSLTTGWLGNTFIWGAPDEVWAANVCAQAALVWGGRQQASEKDMASILKIPVNLPEEDLSVRNLERMEVTATVIIGGDHPFTKWLRTHITTVNNLIKADVWRKAELADDIDPGLKGVMHLRYIMLRASDYWHKQGLSATEVPLEDPEILYSAFRLQDRWEPRMSPAFRSQLKLDRIGPLLRSHGRGGPTFPGDSATGSSCRRRPRPRCRGLAAGGTEAGVLGRGRPPPAACVLVLRGGG